MYKHEYCKYLALKKMQVLKNIIFSGCHSFTEEEARVSSKELSVKNDWGKPCKFPFKYNGEEHVTCTTTERFDDSQNVIDAGVSWCATEIDGSGEVLKSGACQSSCDNGKILFQEMY